MSGPITQAGTLRHAIEFRAPPTTRDQAGQPSRDDADWTSFAKDVPADIETRAATEFFSGTRQEGQADFRFRIRYRPGIKRNMRIKHDGREFEIVAPIDFDERKKHMHILCKEIT